MSEEPSQSHDAHIVGELIVRQNPYGHASRFGHKGEGKTARPEAYQNRVDPGEFEERKCDAAKDASPIGHIEFDGLAQGYFNEDGNRLTQDDLARLRAIPQRGIWWYFGNQPRYISKAIRVPYTYRTRDEDGQEVEVTDHMLIGYEGIGWK